MNYDKLLIDYLNEDKDTPISELVSFEQRNGLIFVVYWWYGDRCDIVIDLFDLLTFVYSRLSVSS